MEEYLIFRVRKKKHMDISFLKLKQKRGDIKIIRNTFRFLFYLLFI